MIVKRISVQSFRNLHRLDLSLSPTLNLILGRNGQGKTNLLEALCLLGTARSFRTAREAELIELGEGHFHVAAEGETDGGERFTLEAALERSGRKRLKKDGEVVRPLSRVVGFLGVVLFGPDEMELAGGGPEVRRRFLDLTACQLRADAIEILKAYRRVLAQKTALLRRNSLLGRAGERGDVEGIDAWDERLAVAGAQVVVLRRQVVKGLRQRAATLYGELGGEPESLGLVYDCSFASDVEGDVEEALRRAVAARSADERARGMALVGPHRDDVVLSLGERTLRRYASQGQKRSATIALKLAQAGLIHEIRGERPIILLDDVFSELDERRAASLWEMVRGEYQTLLTMPAAEHLPGVPPETARFRLEGGAVREEGRPVDLAGPHPRDARPGPDDRA